MRSNQIESNGTESSDLVGEEERKKERKEEEERWKERKE